MENGDDVGHGAELQHETCSYLYCCCTSVTCICFAVCKGYYDGKHAFVEGSNVVVAFAMLNSTMLEHS